MMNVKVNISVDLMVSAPNHVMLLHVVLMKVNAMIIVNVKMH